MSRNTLYSHEISLRTRYGETDQMGIIYHANYLKYMEMGRIEWLRSLGVSYRDLEEQGWLLPVIKAEMDFKKSAYYDECLSVRTYLLQMPLVRISFGYEILNKKEELLVEAKTTLAFMDKSTFSPVRCPDFLMEKLKAQQS
ncbi:acyl-CoA thioesterase [Aureicoccus marinus]|uniref:Thioesterase n=1 Tax=Aureicoccus marinus TaxID=754435 RepID=A0A2S7T5C3_9FLAO|nr:thioesterase family protein [Aureicoccus marinus]PQJ14854.1 thioesterase [Aureicoccus marinus]